MRFSYSSGLPWPMPARVTTTVMGLSVGSGMWLLRCGCVTLDLMESQAVKTGCYYNGVRLMVLAATGALDAILVQSFGRGKLG